MVSKITLKEEMNKLPLPASEKWSQGVWDISPLKHGYMTLTLFTPRGQ